MCELITDTNLKDDEEWQASAIPRVGFTDGVKGFIYHQERRSYDDPAYAYPLGFNRQEADLAIKLLDGSKFGNFVAVRIGEGGKFNPLRLLDCATEKSLTNVDGLASGIEVFCYRV